MRMYLRAVRGCVLNIIAYAYAMQAFSFTGSWELRQASGGPVCVLTLTSRGGWKPRGNFWNFWEAQLLFHYVHVGHFAYRFEQSTVRNFPDHLEKESWPFSLSVRGWGAWKCTFPNARRELTHGERGL